MKNLLALLCCIFLLSCAPSAMAPAQFTAEYARTLKAAIPSARVEVKSDLELKLTDSTGTELSLFLDNAYKEYTQDPRAIQDVLTRYVTSAKATREDDKRIDRTRIVPIVKDRHWLTEIAESLRGRGIEKPIESVFEELNAQLVVVYAEDSSKNIRYLTQESLTEAGLAQSELRALAVTNLRRIIPKIEIHKGPLVSMVTAGGDYEACLLLFDDLWSSGSIKVDGEIVVAIPSRDLLLVTGSKTPGGITKLRELATKASQQASYRLTDTLFVYKNGKFAMLAEE